MEPVYDLMARLLTDRFGVREEEIAPDVTFDELDIDSLAQAELVTVVQDRLRVTLDQEPVGATLGEAAAFIERVMAAGTGTIGPQQGGAGYATPAWRAP
ncbi:phosphopantetheine-binding protein [Streptomyces sp. NPDC046261]|uniref:acyl carrier protein n=1 Tax=Streptomyces sp. NPDC046261 TaxID=3157200 RepID=UPI0033DE9DEC